MQVKSMLEFKSIHRIPIRRSPGLLTILIAFTTLLLQPLQGAAPVLTAVSPPGGQRGSAVYLTLEGVGIDGKLQLHSEIPGTFTVLSQSNSGRQFLLEIYQEAPVGVYPLSVETSGGLSNKWLFRVYDFPEVAEAESKSSSARNNSLNSAQDIQAPITVNGTLSEADRDLYRVTLEAKQEIVLEVEARRLGSSIDAVLQIYGPAGNAVARNDDAPGIGTDARIAFTAPAAGQYFVEVHDSRFSKQQRNFYRLVAGPIEYAEALYPLGWKANEAVEVELSGGTLPEPRKVTVSGSAVAVGGSRASLPQPFLRGSDTETLEPSGGGHHSMAEGQIINGRISTASEIDNYSLDVHEGEEWMIETQAARLGTSQLYTLLVLRDQNGKKLGSAGDQEPEELLSFISSRAETLGDPSIGLKVPAGVTVLQVSVEDLLGRGGAAYGYRLVARKQPPDFILRLDETSINVPRNGSMTAGLTIDRRGYMGAIRLHAEGLPEGVIAEGGYIPAEFGGMTSSRTSRKGKLTLTASKDSMPGKAAVTFYGEGRTSDGETIRRVAQTSSLIIPVAGSNQKSVRLPARTSEVEVAVTESEPAWLEILSTRSLRLIQGLKHDIRWAYHQSDGSVQVTSPVNLTNAPAVANLRILGEAKIKPGDKNGLFEMNTTMGTPAMRFDLILNSEIRHAGVKHSIYAPPITVDIVQGYRIESPDKPVTIQAGQEFTLNGSFEREPEFDSEVIVEAANLPIGVSCASQKINGTPSQYTLDCEAEISVEPGEYAVEITPRSVLAGRDKEAVPYNIPPVEAVIVVGKGSTIAKAQASLGV